MTTETTQALTPLRDALAFQHAKRFAPDDAAQMVLDAELGTRVTNALAAEPCQRLELRIALERLHDDHQNGEVKPSGVIDRLADWRPDLPAPELWALWEHIDTALERLEHVRGDTFCPSEGDQLLLEQEWRASLEAGIDRLIGVRS